METKTVHAFPYQTDQTMEGSLGAQPGSKGMSLREWYAGMALQGALANPHATTAASTAEQVANACFELADAMMERRMQYE